MVKLSKQIAQQLKVVENLVDIKSVIKFIKVIIINQLSQNIQKLIVNYLRL